jgi:phosphoglycolate phosphatase
MSARPRQFDLIAFDWDGTLFDSTQIITRCIQAAVVDVGGVEPTDEAASYVIGMALMQALAHAAPDVPKEKYDVLGERYRFHYMKHVNDIALFDGSRTADETAGKPSPRMLHELMREFGVEPERTLMIGDTTHDLQMAVNAGCACVGVSYGAHDHGQFEPLNPLFIAHSVKELHDWLLVYA